MVTMILRAEKPPKGIVLVIKTASNFLQDHFVCIMIEIKDSINTSY